MEKANKVGMSLNLHHSPKSEGIETNIMNTHDSCKKYFYIVEVLLSNHIYSLPEATALLNLSVYYSQTYLYSFITYVCIPKE